MGNTLVVAKKQGPTTGKPPKSPQNPPNQTTTQPSPNPTTRKLGLGIRQSAPTKPYLPRQFMGGYGSKRHCCTAPVSALAGSQVGSHSLWTCVDGCGRLWNRKPVVPTCVDGCGHPWTRLGDLRIRRLGFVSLRACHGNACSGIGPSTISHQRSNLDAGCTAPRCIRATVLD